MAGSAVVAVVAYFLGLSDLTAAAVMLLGLLIMMKAEEGHVPPPEVREEA